MRPTSAILPLDNKAHPAQLTVAPCLLTPAHDHSSAPTYQPPLTSSTHLPRPIQPPFANTPAFPPGSSGQRSPPTLLTHTIKPLPSSRRANTTAERKGQVPAEALQPGCLRREKLIVQARCHDYMVQS